MRTAALLVGATLLSALLWALGLSALAASVAATGVTTASLSLVLTWWRWGRPVRHLEGSGPVSIRKVTRQRLRFAAVQGRIVDTGAEIPGPVRGEPALAWRLVVTRGGRVLWQGHEGGELRVSDGSGLCAVDLPTWLIFSGEGDPEQFTRAGSGAEHGLRERFGARAEQWLSNPEVRFVETLLRGGDAVIVFGKVVHEGGRPRLSPRVLAVDGKLESLTAELRRRGRRALVLAAVLAALLPLGGYGATRAGVVSSLTDFAERTRGEVSQLTKELGIR